MQCEILAFKKTKTGRVAVVRVPSMNLIGEARVKLDAVVHERGPAYVRSKLTVREGRLVADLIIDEPPQVAAR